MTINDQIRVEKLEYDINREAAKISALSSDKIHKYEYIIGEDILPSNQQQIIQQAKFTCSPLRIAFEKQITSIEDQVENKLMLERIWNQKNKQKQLHINQMNFDEYGGPTYIYGHMKNGEKTLQQVVEEQKYFKKDLNQITSGNPRYKSERQSYTIKNIKNLHDSRQKNIDLLYDNAKIRSEPIYKSKQNKSEGTGP